TSMYAAIFGSTAARRIVAVGNLSPRFTCPVHRPSGFAFILAEGQKRSAPPVNRYSACWLYASTTPDTRHSLGATVSPSAGLSILPLTLRSAASSSSSSGSVLHFDLPNRIGRASKILAKDVR